MLIRGALFANLLWRAIELGSPSSPSGQGCGAARPFAARDFRGQRVQLRLPEGPELADPRIHRLKPRGIHRIEPSLRLRLDAGEAALAEHLQVLRHRRLGDSELGPDRLHHFARRHGAATDELKDAPADRIGEDFKDVRQLPAPGCAMSGGISPR